MAEKVKEVGNGPRGMRGRPRPKVDNPGKLLRRIFSYIFRFYGIQIAMVAVCIVVAVLANIQGTMFTRTLIDSYITPMVEQVKAGQQNPDFSPLLRAMARVACFYIIGIAATYFQARTMAFVTQGTMKRLRIELFEHMESLPVKYFDTHAHGDIMSVYTNDIDTLRQMISQSLPQLLNSSITIVSIFSMMLILSVHLTIVALLMIGVMLLASARVTSLSGRNFIAQQRNLGRLNGFIEETMTGEKVVKVFCHEKDAIRQFDELNEELFQSASKANGFANIIAPVNAQLGNTNYVLCAIVGGILAINTYAGFTVGSLASFLTFNRSFIMPINQVSMQFNSIIMALAGAERIFALLDAEPETDDGYVMLVNCLQDENGEIVEKQEHTGKWAWKHYHRASDTTTYQALEGDITFNGVDFGYRDDKIVLHDIWIHAKPGMKIALRYSGRKDPLR